LLSLGKAALVDEQGESKGAGALDLYASDVLNFMRKWDIHGVEILSPVGAK
jgi:hypothetical protein